MDISKYINLIYAVVVWVAVFILIKPGRIKRLLPLGILSALILFGVELYFMSLMMHKYNNPLLPIAGIPLFHLIWGAGSGIIFFNYLKKGFSKKLLVIFFFTILTQVFFYIANKVGSHTGLNGFNDMYHFILNFFTLSILAFFGEGLFGRNIYPDAK